MCSSKKNRRSKYAQNKIEYIVFGNPTGAKKLLLEKGYQAYPSVKDNAAALKQLVQKEGKTVIKDLIQIHPDKAAILAITKDKEDSFCGACSNYTYNPENNYCGSCGHSNYVTEDIDIGDFLDQMVDMSTSEVEKYYKDILSKSNKNPEDLTLADEVQLVFNELRVRKNKDLQEEMQEKEGTSKLFISENRMVVLGLTLVAGILIGSQLRQG